MATKGKEDPPCVARVTLSVHGCPEMSGGTLVFLNKNVVGEWVLVSMRGFRKSETLPYLTDLPAVVGGNWVIGINGVRKEYFIGSVITRFLSLS